MADDRLPLFGSYSLDTARGSLLRAGEPVHLRPQAYEALKYFAEHRGRLIGKDALIQHVWQGRAVGDDSLVQCLRDVRHALGDDAATIVRNVRGRGYIFDPGPSPSMSSTVTETVDVIHLVVEENESEDEPVSGASLPATGRRTAFRGRALPVSVTALLLATVLGATALVAYKLLGERLGDPTPIESLAVLPFVNDTGDNDADYLADGSTESLINSLARLPAVSVKARTTVFRYKGNDLSPPRVAQELGVQALVYGRLVRRDDKLTVYLSLVDGRNGNQLWGNQYTESIGSLPAMQRRIAEEVARKLQTPSAVAGNVPTAGYTTNGDAYLLYLRGRYHSDKTTQTGFRTAITFYQRAIEVDTHYALAHAGLADAYRALSIVGRVPSKEAFPQARAAALRALELDDRLAEAYIALGFIRFSYDWEWAAAERELQTAIEINPRNADAHRAYAHLLSNQARHDEAIVEAERACELDPRSLLTNVLAAQFFFYGGRLDDAEDRYRKTLEIEPEYWPAHQGLGRVYTIRGMFPEAISGFRKAISLSSGAVEPVTQLGYALAKSGNSVEARALLRELASASTDEPVPAYSSAMILNGLGDKEAALRQLERSVSEREVQSTFIKIDTRWDSVRPDPRFVALLKRMNLQ